MRRTVSLSLNNRRQSLLGNRQERVSRSGSLDGINSDPDRAVSTVLETDRHGECRREFSVNLGFGGSGSNGTPSEKISEILRRNDICDAVSLGVLKLKRWQRRTEELAGCRQTNFGNI